MKNKNTKLHFLSHSVYIYVILLAIIMSLSACDNDFSFSSFDKSYERSTQYIVVIGTETNPESGHVLEDYTYIYNNGVEFFMKHEDYFIMNDDNTITAIILINGSYYSVTTDSFYDFQVPNVEEMEDAIKDKEYEKKGNFPFTYYLFYDNELFITLESRDYDSLEYVYKEVDESLYFHFNSTINPVLPDYTEISYTDYLLQDSPFSIVNNVISGSLGEHSVSIHLDDNYATILLGENSYNIDYSPSLFIVTLNENEIISLNSLKDTIGTDNYYLISDIIFKDKYFMIIEEVY